MPGKGVRQGRGVPSTEYVQSNAEESIVGSGNCRRPSQSAGREESVVGEEVSEVKVVQDLVRLVQGFVLVHRRETRRIRRMTWEVIALV